MSSTNTHEDTNDCCHSGLDVVYEDEIGSDGHTIVAYCEKCDVYKGAMIDWGDLFSVVSQRELYGWEREVIDE